MKKVELLKNLLKIQFHGSAFRENLNRVKSLSGRKFKGGANAYWTCPPSFENFEQLESWEFEFDSPAKKLWAEMNEQKNVVIDSIPGFERMFPYQLKGVEFIESHGGRALVGDEMGLGKTVQALGYLGLHPELRPAVVVCPASLKLNWEKEINEWLPESSVEVLSGKKPHPVNAQILIINYDILSAWEYVLADCKVLILDEAHYIKNAKAQRSKSVKKLAKKVKHVIALTGTPITNRPSEFFPILNLINSAEWPNFWRYAEKYCDKKYNGFGWDFSGSSNPDELNEKVQSTMIRRLKSEVLPDLPDKIRTVIPLEITNRAEYNQAVNELDASDSPAIQLTRIEALKQLVVLGKMNACIEWISNFLESGQKLVVFCTHKNVVDKLMDEFHNIAVKVDGSVSTLKRQQKVECFQESSMCRLFIGNIKAAGVGLTLTAASSTAFIELPWEPGSADQAEDRVHRIGQEADSVNAYYLLGQDTIDMEIASLLDSKREVLDAVLDGHITEDSSLLTELMDKLLNGQNSPKKQKRSRR